MYYNINKVYSISSTVKAIEKVVNLPTQSVYSDFFWFNSLVIIIYSLYMRYLFLKNSAAIAHDMSHQPKQTVERPSRLYYRLIKTCVLFVCDGRQSHITYLSHHTLTAALFGLATVFVVDSMAYQSSCFTANNPLGFVESLVWTRPRSKQNH